MHTTHRASRTFAVTAGLCLAALQSSAQRPAATVELRGAAGQRTLVSTATLDSLGRQDVRAQAHGIGGVFSGVPLYDLLRLVGAPGGDSLRGRALSAYVLIEAADGYAVTFSIGELSPSVTNRVVLLADRVDGAPLGPTDGPFRLVAPEEKRPARWVRQVTRISIVLVPPGTAPSPGARGTGT